jgi:hypothetical protein
MVWTQKVNFYIRGFFSLKLGKTTTGVGLFPFVFTVKRSKSKCGP